MLRNRFFQKSFIGLFLLLSSVSFAIRPAHAGIKEWLYEKAEQIIPELDITKTVQSVLIELMVGFPASVITDRNLDELSNCALLSRDIYSQETGAYLGPPTEVPLSRAVVTSNSSLTPDEQQALLDRLDEAVAALSEYDPHVCDFNNDHPFGTGTGDSGMYRGSGSLFAFASNLRDSALKEPLPVNMAFFIKDYARRIPIIQNSAYAQTNYNILGGQLIYQLWTASRNIALGLMSLILLVVGVMIMTRKKINPQAVVSVQNALPRVAMGITLVFFSYPIGALFAALVLPLGWSALGIAFSLGGSAASGQAAGTLNWLVGIAMNLIFYFSGVGVLAVLASVLVLLISIILAIICWVRAVFIYIKILINIVFAPLQFTLGVLPGKENSTLDWFKTMAADLLSVPAMFAMISVSWYVGWFGLFGNLENRADGTWGAIVGEGFSRIIVSIFTPMAMLFCLMTALKMPGKVQKMIFGDKKR